MLCKKIRTGSYRLWDLSWMEGYLTPKNYSCMEEIQERRSDVQLCPVQAHSRHILQLKTANGLGKLTDCGYDQIQCFFTKIPSVFDFKFHAGIRVSAFPLMRKLTFQEGCGLFLRSTMNLDPRTGFPYSNALYAGACFGGFNAFLRHGVSEHHIEQVHNHYLIDYTEDFRQGTSGLQKVYIAPEGMEAQITLRKQDETFLISIYDCDGRDLLAEHWIQDHPNHNAGLNAESRWQKEEEGYRIGIKPDFFVEKEISLGFFAAANASLEVLPEHVTLEIEKRKRKSFLISTAETVTKIEKRIQSDSYKKIDGEFIHVSPDGTPAGSGLAGSPLDLQTAINCCEKGQTILLDQGRYFFSETVRISKENSGTAEQRKKIICCAKESLAVLDFQGTPFGFDIQGSYWDVEGLAVERGHGFLIRGSHNRIRACKAAFNLESGFLIRHQDDKSPKNEWPSDNLVEACLSYCNKDASEHNADGFACKVSSGEGNRFYRCKAFLNSDDGFDLFSKNRITGRVQLSECQSWMNGYYYDGTWLCRTGGGGNGFKLGGSGLSIAHTARNCDARGNAGKGFTSNSNPMLYLEDCTAANNLKNYDYYFCGTNAFARKVIKNCIVQDEQDYIPEIWFQKNLRHYFDTE